MKRLKKSIENIYPMIKKLLGGTAYHKLRTGLLGVLCAAVIIGAVVVLPILASETEEEPTTEVVTEEELEPVQTPEMTEEPVETEIPDTPEPTEEMEGEQDGQEKELDKDQPSDPQDQNDEEEQGGNNGDQLPVINPEETQGQEGSQSTDTENKENAPKIKTMAAAEKLGKPSVRVDGGLTGEDIYPMTKTISLSVTAAKPEGAGSNVGIGYQWYMKPSEGIAEALTGNGAKGSTYTIPKNLDAGTYYYYCEVKCVDNDGKAEASDVVKSENITITIEKGNPKLSDFNLNNLKSSYFYTGEAIDPVITTTCKGMGDAYIVIMDGDTENRPKEECTNVPVYLHIKNDGKNYEGATINTNKSITITRLSLTSSSCPITGDRGKVVNGTQWYISDVSITPTSAYWISETEDGLKSEPKEKLVYNTEGANQGPENSVVYLRRKSDNAISNAITIAKFNIDKTAPKASITYSGGSMVTNGSLEFSLEASDDTNGSGVAGRYYFKTAKEYTEAELKKLTSGSWTVWEEGKPYTVDGDKDETFYFCAKVEDVAGNVTCKSVGPMVIDKTNPVIKCNKKILNEEKTYVADKKTIVVEDDNLDSVTVEKIGGQSEPPILAGGSKSMEIPLSGASDPETEKVEYKITVKDIAGNEKVTTITLKNPHLAVDAGDLSFGSGENAITYGYASVTPQGVTLKKKGSGETVTVDSLEIELDSEGAFEIVNGNTVKPKQKLDAGRHSAVIRVNYDGDEESTTTCVCSVDVKQAPMRVRYTGQKDVGYHTIPDLVNTIEFEAADFRNGDTVKDLKEDPEFELPSLYYEDDDKIHQKFSDTDRALKTMKLIPQDGQSKNYEFTEYGAGELEVRRHSLREGYVINGARVAGYDWYSSKPVVIEAAPGYRISRTGELAADFNQNVISQISVEGEAGTNPPEEFYVMNDKTGEISELHTELIQIDTSKPYFREGEGITVSNDLFAEFMNNITFGVFFNDTKRVTISATDDESKPVTIEYCVSDEKLGENDMNKLTWQLYEEGGFSISPDEYDRAVIYAKITNKAGLVTYISSYGMIFDNKQPDINKVENGKEQAIIDEKEYVTEEFDLKVSDRNLKNAMLFEGTNIAVSGSALQIVEENNDKKATQKIRCPKSGSKTYTVVASDEADNHVEREFTITKPVYDIKADTLKIKPFKYGYEATPQVAVTWQNGETANADATVTNVILADNKYFEVNKMGDSYWITAKQGLAHGTYSADVTLVYNEGKEAKTTCSFTVEKAVLTATYVGDDLYYHEKIKDSSVRVTGFVKHNGVLETPETAAGYKEPVVLEDGLAKETCELIPSGGEADNYSFVYRPGLLLVERRHATTGKDGQYSIAGTISNSGWYTSNIVIRPKDGYALLLNEEDSKPQESITLSRDTDQGEKDFYITNTETGEIYHPSTLHYKRDTVPPSIMGIEDGATYDANTKVVTVEDDYLTSVTVNGASRKLDGGKRLTLVAEQEKMVYVVVATDCAGNVTSKTIVMNQLETIPDFTEEPEEASPTAAPGATPGAGATATPSPTATPKANNNNDTKQDDEEDDALEGIIKKLVKVVQGAPDTSLTTSTSELKTSVLTNGEQKAVSAGSNANIELRVKNIDSSVPQGDKELLIANLNGYSVGEYLDITLWKKVGSSSQKKVTSTNRPITITVSIPQSLRKLSREFVVLRVHGGSVSVLSDRDSAANTVTFATDKFSTYVLAYKQGSGSQSAGNISVGNGGSTGNTTYYDASPETGDKAPILPVSIVFVVSLAGILATLTLRRRTR